MRQRKAKDLDKRLQECSMYMIESPGDGNKDYFNDDKDLFLEIGCGKGQFIIKKAKDNPDADFIAIEGQETVILRALEKAKEEDERQQNESDCKQGLSNLKFMLTFVHTIDKFFNENQLSGIYLNFSDPWPKARHAKRRLTYRKRLQDYSKAIKKGGFIEIKTDNDALYDFTLEEIDAVGCKIAEQTRDLHNSNYASRFTTTEYEDRFKDKGKNINYVKIIIE